MPRPLPDHMIAIDAVDFGRTLSICVDRMCCGLPNAVNVGCGLYESVQRAHWIILQLETPTSDFENFKIFSDPKIFDLEGLMRGHPGNSVQISIKCILSCKINYKELFTVMA